MIHVLCLTKKVSILAPGIAGRTYYPLEWLLSLPWLFIMILSDGSAFQNDKDPKSIQKCHDQNRWVRYWAIYSGIKNWHIIVIRMSSIQHIPNYFLFKHVPTVFYWTYSKCSFSKKYSSISQPTPTPVSCFRLYLGDLEAIWMLFTLLSCLHLNNMLTFHVNLNYAMFIILCKIVIKYHWMDIWNNANSSKFVWLVQNSITKPEHQLSGI